MFIIIDIIFVSIYSDIQTYNIRSLSAHLKKQGFSTKIIFLPRPFKRSYSRKVINQIIKLLSDTRLIGVSLTSNYWDNAYNITLEIKKHIDVPIVWGGIHPTINPEECLDIADMVCIGKSEESLQILLNKIKTGDKNYKDIPNFAYNENGKKIKNDIKKIYNNNHIPIPDYDLEDHYILFGDKIYNMDKKLFRFFYGETYTTQCTFGCPYVCTYCCNNFFNKNFGYNPIKRPILEIIEELEYIHKKFKFFKTIRFDDDNFFTYSIDELKLFRDEYKKKIGLSLIIMGGHPLNIKKEMLEIVIDSGMTWIRLGIQTGSDNIKRLYKRNINNKIVLDACNNINHFKKLKVMYDFILDNPWESEKDKIETLKLIIDIPHPYTLTLFSLTFFQGTELYKKAIDEKLIKDVKNDIYRKNYRNYKYDYFNLLFFLFSKRYIPKKLKEYLISDIVLKSKSKRKALIRIISLLNRIDNLRSEFVFLIKYMFKLDINRIIFSFKKFYYDKMGDK